MHLKTRDIGGFTFWCAGGLQLRRRPDGSIDEYSYQLDETVRPNRHAAGPFCYFSLPAAPRASGVYAFLVGDEVKYVGECVDLLERFGPRGYGQIHPRNLHDDGQSTNCKLNAAVLAAVKAGLEAEVWFHATADHKVVEARVLTAGAPPWNGRQPTTTGGSAQDQRRNRPSSTEFLKPSGVIRAAFEQELVQVLAEAERSGSSSLQVRAGDLHKRVGGYPGPDHRMPVCCATMRGAMQAGDRLVRQPPKGNGANLVVEYQLPR